jgi:hypothetical protein
MIAALIEGLKTQLEEMGYQLRYISGWDSTGKSYTYYMDTAAVDLAQHLAMERVLHGLSGFEPMGVKGNYVAKVGVKNGMVTGVDYTFYYTIRAKREAATAEVLLSGRLDAPFPHGRPTECNLQAKLFVGPVAMGKGQKTHARRLAEETLTSTPAFVEAFPEARVIAILETRGGHGGWKRKQAWHTLGRARELVAC